MLVIVIILAYSPIYVIYFLFAIIIGLSSTKLSKYFVHTRERGSSPRDVWCINNVLLLLLSCRYTPLPDSMLAKQVGANEPTSSLLPGDTTPGFNTPASDIDMKKIGQASYLWN